MSNSELRVTAEDLFHWQLVDTPEKHPIIGNACNMRTRRES